MSLRLTFNDYSDFPSSNFQLCVLSWAIQTIQRYPVVQQERKAKIWKKSRKRLSLRMFAKLLSAENQSTLSGAMRFINQMCTAFRVQTIPYASVASSLYGIIIKRCQLKHICANASLSRKLWWTRHYVTAPDWWNNGVSGASKKSKVATSSSSNSVSSFGKLTTQSSLRSFAIPHLNASDQRKFNHEIAMHFYCTGTSFTRVEDPYLLRAIQLLRPGARLPTRKQLADDSSGGLFEDCYQKVNAEVNKLLSVNTQYICITNDACSSVLNEPIVNYMAVPNQVTILRSCSHRRLGAWRRMALRRF